MNMKKIAAIAAAAVMAVGICAGVPAGTENSSLFAVTAEAASSDFVIETDSYGYKYVSGYTGKGGNITIPDGVDYIGDEAFGSFDDESKMNNTITSVTFPKSCMLVGENAFTYCSSLKSVVFNGDASICDEAFFRCAALESVTVKGSLCMKSYGLSTMSGGIENSTFSDCVSLKTVKIEKNDYEFSIGNCAFKGCISLSSINIPDKCITIGHSCFDNCFALEKLTIPAKTKIVKGADYDKSWYGDSFEPYYFGYASISNKEGGSPDLPFLADGKKSGYYSYWARHQDQNMKEVFVTPKQLTVTVTKGSSAEEYCKENGIKYVYTDGSSADTTAAMSTTAPTVKKLAAPTGIKGTASSDKIVLTWNKVDGAEGYRIYKYDEKTGKYLKYKDVKNEKCTVKGLKASTKYKFKIYALVSEKGEFAVQTPTNAFSFTTKAAKKAAEPFDDTLITL